MQSLNIKEKLIEYIVTDLSAKYEEAKTARDFAQEEANQHKGAMASRYDTFKQEAQFAVNGFSIQMDTFLRDISLAKKLSLLKSEVVLPGSLVTTNELINGKLKITNYFISVACKSTKIDNVEYTFISLISPIGQILKGNKIGNIVLFREKKIEIKNIL